jgi:hypothetical protein
VVAVAGQQAAGQFLQAGFVFDEQDRLAAAAGGCGGRCCGAARFFAGGGQQAGDGGAGVGDLQPGVAAWGEARPALGVGLVHGDVRGVDGELPAAGHRVAGVDGEVDQNLLELPGVGLDRPQVIGECDGQGDVLAEGAAQQLLQAGDDLIEG